jgi:hypothetical protein
VISALHSAITGNAVDTLSARAVIPTAEENERSDKLACAGRLAGRTREQCHHIVHLERSSAVYLSFHKQSRAARPNTSPPPGVKTKTNRVVTLWVFGNMYVMMSRRKTIQSQSQATQALQRGKDVQWWFRRRDVGR